MLEIRKNTYSRNYENTFFRELARHLHKSFVDNGRSGLLIGSPFCEVDERLQIDALLITKQVICIIDFKNFSGKINLPNERNFEIGIWTNATGDQIKGGSSINPFIQLKNQKRRFSEVYNKHIQKDLKKDDIFNPNHTVRIICFQEETELNGRIPSNEALNFFILDKITFLEGLLDIIDVTDKEVNISPNSYDAFKKVFRADKFKFDDKPLENKLKVFAEKSATLDFKKLYVDQHSALTEIKTFLENPEQQVFVLQGTTNSGKSYLIPFIQELAYNLGIQETEIFASSSRVANNLITIGGSERVNSIYSYIYGGQKNNKQEEQTKEKENTEEIDEANDSEELQVEEIPLKNCDNEENALFIVDESQLVSDSFNQSIDLIFGTGYLLKDFLSFTNSVNTKRKIIFIGDPFQLQLGKTDESPLNPLYLEEAYKLKTNAYQLLDKPNFSVISKEALFCVDKIRTKYFNSLQFIEDESFCFLQKEDVKKAVSDIIHNKTECHILCFSNEESQKVNYWIKQSIIENGQNIAINDLVLFNNNISIEDINDPFAEPKKVYNGQFATITAVNNTTIEKIIKTKKNQESTVLTFREISLTLNETGQKAIVLSLENYRTNAKAELSKNEIVAFKMLLNSYIAEYLKLHPFENSTEYSEIIKSEKYDLLETEIKDLKQKLKSGEKVKTKLDEKIREQKRLIKSANKKHRSNIEATLRKDPSTEYYKFKNSALLRFGWAMTIDKSSSYKWKEVIINTNTGARFNGSKTHETFYRMLYTAITRAKTKVSLINYKPISPFDKTEFVDDNCDKKTKDFFFISESLNIEIAKKELIELLKFKLTSDFVLNQIDIPGYNVRIEFNKDSKQTTLDFGFNLKNQFKFPKYINGDTNLSNKIIELISNENLNFDSINELWKKTEYIKLNNELTKKGYKIKQILQTEYKDQVKITNNIEELDLDFHYTIEGFFSFIKAKYYSNIIAWEDFINTVNHIKL